MRVLVLGGGALGGHFGGRLHQAGLDPCFPVRPVLARDGLRISSGLGDDPATVTTITPDAFHTGWDGVLLTCKANDLPDAMETIRPAMDAHTVLSPVLNGFSHIEGAAMRLWCGARP